MIPSATKASANSIAGVIFSPGIKSVDKIDPETGTMNLYIVISPAGLYFNREYQRAKATEESKAE